MNETKINKNLLLIFRLLCSAVGAAAGIVAIWRVFASNPVLVERVGLKVVFYFACGIVPAVLLWLSAKPLLHFVLSLRDKARSHFDDVKTGKADETAEPETENPDYTGADGYVLAGSALKSDKIINLCENWLGGEVFVLNTTVDCFIETADVNPVSADAAERFRTLENDGKINVVRFECDAENEDDRVVSFACEKNLKILVQNRESFGETAFPVHILALDEL